MNQISGTMFFLSTFACAFAFGFPLRPSSLEMLGLATLNLRSQAWSLAAGVACADAAWALAALAGLLPWLNVGRPEHKGPLFLLTALVCAFLAWRGGPGPVRPPGGKKARGRSSFWKGALLGATYPLTFGSWVVTLAIMRGIGWRVPAGLPWHVLFFFVVFLGYFTYMALLQALFKHVFHCLETKCNGWLHRLPRLLLLALAGLFLGMAAAEFLS
jgi:threonine/homoserine/homoserine lactone efflux protein